MSSNPSQLHKYYDDSHLEEEGGLEAGLSVSIGVETNVVVKGKDNIQKLWTGGKGGIDWKGCVVDLDKVGR